MTRPHLCTAFAGDRQCAAGPFPDVAGIVRTLLSDDPTRSILVFDDETGRVVDLDPREANIAPSARPEPAGEGEDPVVRGRGRPKLGVIGREVTLLPRQWDWLAQQPGGASVALRKLVDEARRAGDQMQRKRAAEEAAYRFVSAIAGDRPGYEEAIRALFAHDHAGFARRMTEWPEDISAFALKLAGAGAG